MWQLVAAVGLWWVASTATTIASRSVMLQEEDEADLRWPVHEALSDLRWVGLTALQQLVGAAVAVVWLKAVVRTSLHPTNASKRVMLIAALCNVLGNIGINLAYTMMTSSATLVIKACYSLGPLLDAVLELNPSIIPTAFLGSCMIFTSLSLAALYSERRSLLFLGAFLMSGLSLLLLLLMINLFIGSYLAFQFELYFGLLLFCGFVLFDTQLIVEKFNSGSDDYIWHSVDLFLDFVNIFRRLLVILASKEKKRKN